MKKFPISFVATIAFMASAILSLAAPYEKGQAVESFETKDQHGKAFTLKPTETKFLLVSHDMETGKRANAVLTDVGADSLAKQKTVFMANIHGMPWIGRLFAMPKMAKYNHQIVLADDEKLIAKFPAQTGKVTVLALVNGKVASVQYWTPGTDALENFLK